MTRFKPFILPAYSVEIIHNALRDHPDWALTIQNGRITMSSEDFYFVAGIEGQRLSNDEFIMMASMLIKEMERESHD